jgi:hypothetical protein
MSNEFMSWGCGSQMNEKSLVNISFTRLKFLAPLIDESSSYNYYTRGSISSNGSCLLLI